MSQYLWAQCSNWANEVKRPWTSFVFCQSDSCSLQSHDGLFNTNLPLLSLFPIRTSPFDHCLHPVSHGVILIVHHNHPPVIPPSHASIWFIHLSILPGDDLERHDGSSEKPFLMSPELHRILGKSSQLHWFPILLLTAWAGSLLGLHRPKTPQWRD